MAVILIVSHSLIDGKPSFFPSAISIEITFRSRPSIWIHIFGHRFDYLPQSQPSERRSQRTRAAHLSAKPSIGRPATIQRARGARHV